LGLTRCAQAWRVPNPSSHVVKISTLLLSLSFAANAALLAVVCCRHPASSESASTGAAAISSTSGEASKSTDALRSALASGNSATMQAAGVPADVARQLAL